MKPASEICRLWHEAGIVRQRRMAFYCGTGWRASLAFFYAWLMDWPHISVYDGGWCEWSGDPANAVVCRTGTG
jgi:thiosulfate/3-mercaptopyruvate sulfurtransferase